MKNEGITEGVHLVGDTMYEIAKQVEVKVDSLAPREDIPEDYLLGTIHRAENTTDEKMPIIVNELFSLDKTLQDPGEK